MRFSKLLKPAAAFAAILLAAIVEHFPTRQATDDDDDNSNDSRIQRGFDIAPVHLNLEGKNRALVGLGSYIVTQTSPATSAMAPALRSINSCRG